MSKRKKIAILATGGTIAGCGKVGMAADYKAGEIPVASIMKSIPQINDLAEIETFEISKVDSNDITFKQIGQIRTLCDALEKDESIDGIVITHGTDTFEETAFALNLLLTNQKPVIMTGAMRPASAASADGPMNLYQAVALACDERAAGMGVLGVFNDTIYSANEIKKTDSHKTDAFKYNEYGTIGFMRDGQAFLVHQPLFSHTLIGRFHDVNLNELPQVEIFYVHQESDPELLKYMLEKYDGVVLAGTGSGNYPRPIQDVIESYEGSCRIVRASRLLNGKTFPSPVFDPEKRTVPAYKLSPHKARLLLMLTLAKTRDESLIHRCFATY